MINEKSKAPMHIELVLYEHICIYYYTLNYSKMDNGQQPNSKDDARERKTTTTKTLEIAKKKAKNQMHKTGLLAWNSETAQWKKTFIIISLIGDATSFFGEIFSDWELNFVFFFFGSKQFQSLIISQKSYFCSNNHELRQLIVISTHTYQILIVGVNYDIHMKTVQNTKFTTQKIIR